VASVPPDRIGKYSVIRKIASGGMAEVYLCRLRGEEGFEKKVAVKIILPRFSSEPRFRDLFVREARIAAKLVHPNLVQVFDFGREGGSYFLAMEFIDGWNLAQAVSRARLCGTPVPLPVWRYWVEGILSGIGHLHSKGIVHGDISPSNILLSRGGVVKITDFGISRGAHRKAGSAGGSGGKHAYLSPEQARGEEANMGSDLFAAAVVSAEIVLPRRVFEGASVVETLARLSEYDGSNAELDALPSPVSEVVRKGLSADRRDRYRDAEEFSQALCAAVHRSAGRSEILAYWEVLFPGENREEEDTIAPPGSDRTGDGSVVREKREGYGERSGKVAKFGVLSALVALSAGGYVLWKGNADVSRPAPPPSPAASLSPEPLRPPGDARWEPQVPSGEVEREAVRPREAHPAAALPGSAVTAAPPPAPPHTPSLQPGNTVLIETDPTGVSLSLEDGTLLGKTPLGINLTPWLGKRIVFHKEGYIGKNVQADLLAQVKSFRLELEQQTGTIEVVQAIPWAKVFTGNKYIGDTPIHDLKLAVGVHRLRFVNDPLALEKTLEISVRPGANPKVIVLLVEKRQED
jgi:serine/threonine-protein kinase